MSYEPDNYGPEPSEAAARLKAPGMFLIVTGVLNLVAGLGCAGVALLFLAVPNEMFEQAMAQQGAEQRRNLEEQGIGIKQLRNIYVYGSGIPGVLSLISGPLILFGGVQMTRGRGYGLAVFAAIPALFTGLCILGQAAGIWALVVLMNAEVKQAFR